MFSIWEWTHFQVVDVTLWLNSLLSLKHLFIASSKPLWNEYHSWDITVRFNLITCISNEEKFERKTIENIYVRAFLHVNYRLTRKKKTPHLDKTRRNDYNFSGLIRHFSIIFVFLPNCIYFSNKYFLNYIESNTRSTFPTAPHNLWKYQTCNSKLDFHKMQMSQSKHGRLLFVRWNS